MRISGRLAHSGFIYRTLRYALRRGSLVGGKALHLSSNFSNAMQLTTILRAGMSYLTVQVLFR